jgi:ferric-dicitrate binding protein FerR (iron transport regulator)
VTRPRTGAWGLTLATTAVCLASASAGQISLPSPVPPRLPPALVGNLQDRHDSLVRQHDLLDRDIDTQNGECGDVTADETAKVAACQRSQTRILAEKTNYKAALEQYERALRNLPPEATTAAAPRAGAAAGVSETFIVDSRGKRRPLRDGDPLLLNDHVVTGPNGRAKFLLLDETVFTIGPNSDIVMDEFVYDPATSAGKITASLVKGTFRFISGKVAHHDPRDMKLRVPSGAIGDRGTEYEVVVQQDGSVRLKVFEGEVSFTANSGGPPMIISSGQMTTIAPSGRALPPRPVG